MIVNVKVVEGERTRIQAYEGVCIGRSGRGLNESFTVRKISYGEGVERVFPLYSPMIDSIKLVRRGKVRRAKLYYLRGLRGKSARIAEGAHHGGQATDVERRKSQRPSKAGLPAFRHARSKRPACPAFVHCRAMPRAAWRPRAPAGPLFGRLTRHGPSLKAAAKLRTALTRFNSTWHKPRTFYDKIWADHLVDEQPDGTCLLYIDRHIVHEVTSPQAFEGLRLSGRKVRAPDKTLLVVDHNVPTTDRKLAQSRSGKRRRRSRISPRTPSCSASNITTSSTSARASATSSARSRASRCRARRSSAATATPRRTARSARSPTASAPPRSSTCWRRRR